MWSNDVICGKFDFTMTKEQEINELRSFIRAIGEALGTSAEGRDLIEVAKNAFKAERKLAYIESAAEDRKMC